MVDRDGNIYFGGDDDFVYAIDAGGELRWIFETEGNVDGDPVITPDGTLLVGSDDRHMYALRADPVPAPTEPTPTVPAPTVPAPTEAAPSEAAPSEAAPTDPPRPPS